MITKIKISKDNIMKKNQLYNLVIVFVSIVLLATNCVSPKNEKRNNRIIEVNKIDENFDEFIKLFYSDSLFQLNRIIFPLENDIKIEKEYADALKDSDNIKITDEDSYVPNNKSNWVILNDVHFKNNDSIATIDGITYKRRFYKTNNFVEENILHVDDEFVMVKLKFKLINDKWYLVDYVDGFAY